MRSKLFCVISSVFILFTLCSCKQKTVFVADRHGLSYEEIKQTLIETKKDTLILFDYHNDVNFVTNETTSYNWVGKLIQEDLLKKVYWICGYEVTPIEINAKNNWLVKNADSGSITDKEKVLQAFEITDYKTFLKQKIKNNFLVTVDFDLFTLSRQSELSAINSDKKISAQDFTLEVSKWIKKQNPELVTFSLSAVYQPSSTEAWDCLYTFLKSYNCRNTKWILKCGDFGEKPESKEDVAGWINWKENPEIFSRYDNGFYCGAYLWINAPEKIRKNLLEKKINCRDKDKTTSEIINAWKQKNNPEFKKLEKLFTEKYFDTLGSVAYKSLEEKIQGKNFEYPSQKKDFLAENNLGIAVRFRNKKVDRGCFALPFGLDTNCIEKEISYCASEDVEDPRYKKISSEEIPELYVNISVFSSWEKMENCFDFVPGYDSLIVENKNASDFESRYTLLQATIASEYSYSKNAFLKRLCKKAGIPGNNFGSEDLIYYKTPTITYTGSYK